MPLLCKLGLKCDFQNRTFPPMSNNLLCKNTLPTQKKRHYIYSFPRLGSFRSTLLYKTILLKPLSSRCALIIIQFIYSTQSSICPDWFWLSFGLVSLDIYLAPNWEGNNYSHQHQLHFRGQFIGKWVILLRASSYYAERQWESVNGRQVKSSKRRQKKNDGRTRWRAAARTGRWWPSPFQGIDESWWFPENTVLMSMRIWDHPLTFIVPFTQRTRQGEGPSIEMRVLLKSNASGAIIGKSGTNIKRLRETFKGVFVTSPFMLTRNEFYKPIFKFHFNHPIQPPYRSPTVAALNEFGRLPPSWGHAWKSCAILFLEPLKLHPMPVDPKIWKSDSSFIKARLAAWLGNLVSESKRSVRLQMLRSKSSLNAVPSPLTEWFKSPAKLIKLPTLSNRY